jgi:hypothetical protein
VFVARYKKIRRSDKGHRQKVVIVGVGRGRDRGKIRENDGGIPEFVDEATRERRCEALAYLRVAGSPASTRRVCPLRSKGQTGLRAKAR